MKELKVVADRSEITPILKEYVDAHKLENPIFHIRTEYVGVNVVVNYEHSKPISVIREGSAKISFLPSWVVGLFPTIKQLGAMQIKVHATLFIPRENPETSWFELTKEINKILKDDYPDKRLTYRAYSVELFNKNSLKYEYLDTQSTTSILNAYFLPSHFQFLRYEWLVNQDTKFVEFFPLIEIDARISIKGYTIFIHPEFSILEGGFPEIIYRTRLRAIEDLQGTSGVFMPIGVIDPIRITSTHDDRCVYRIHLESYRRIDELDIHLNDVLLIHLSPLGIPLVYGVDINKREIDGSNIIPIYPPEKCPVCSELLYKHSIYHRCLNGFHGSQLKGIAC